jgi:mediator of RNA polymerase II transcription subunit 6
VEVYGEELINRELGAFNSGFEYIIAHSAPPRMFIIHRRTVEAGGKRDKVDAVYWILNERIYPTPSLYDIMANRTVC